MTTTIRQSKIYDGLFVPGTPIDMTPDIPTVEGNLIVMLWLAQTDAYIDVQPFNFAGLIPTEGINSFAGYGRQKASMIEYAGGVFMGPTQPMIADYHKLGGVSEASGSVPIQVVLYELTSDLGPLVSWASYGIDSPSSIAVYDWLAVPSGYNKPRPVLAFAMTPPGETPPTLSGVSEFSAVSNPIDNFRVRLADVEWGMNENRVFSIAQEGFVGYVSGVAEQSRYTNVQHIHKNSGSVTPAVDGSPVTAKNLLVLSARYKNSAGPFAMPGWDVLSKTSAENPDLLTVVTWWKQAGNGEPESYTVPGTPLNVSLREVSGFTDGVRRIAYACFDNTVDPTEFSGEFSPAAAIALRESFGQAFPLGNFPDNDAYFYSAIAFASSQTWAFNLPDPIVQEDQVLVASGDGWDFYPDGMSVAPITAGASSGFNTRIDFDAEWSLPEVSRQAVAVGAIFVNALPATDVINELVWTKKLDPGVGAIFAASQYRGATLVTDNIDALEELRQRVITLQETVASLQTAIDMQTATIEAVGDEQVARAARLDDLEA
jgi:hypothetical protein